MTTRTFGRVKGTLPLAISLLAGNVSVNAADDAPQQLPAVTVSGDLPDQGYVVSESRTATRTDTPIFDTPMSIQVIPESLIDDQQSFRLADVLKNVSGVQSQHAYGGGYENFVLRGFLQSPVSYRNGIRIPISRIELANAARVEVLKGPAATLYGQADPGGLINVVTKSPTSNPEYALQQGIGSYDFYRTEASASGPITPDASLRYRVDFSYLNGETFRDLSDNERIFVAPAFSWQVTPTTLVDLSYQHADDSLVYDSGTPAVGTGLADIPIERSFTQPGLVDDHQNDILEFNVTQAFSDRWKLSAGVTAFRNEKDFNEFYFFANLAPGDRLGDRYAWFGGEELTTYTAWGNLVGDFETGPIKHRLLLGLERFELSMDSEATDQYVDTIDIFAFDPAQSNVDVTPFEISGPDFIGNQDNTANAVYLQDQLTILENLHLMGGFRYDSIERELEAAYYSPLTVSSRDDSSVSPRAGIVYHPLPWLALYGSYAESFGPGFGYEASQLSDPETARQYEVGLKTELLGGRLISTLAIYDLTKSNILTPDPNNPALSVAIGEARSRGVEIDVQASLSEGWSLVSTYAYTDTEILRDGSGNEGNVLPYAAPHQGSLWLKHDFQSNRLKGLSAGAGIYAAGKRYGDAANSYSDDAYARLDLFAAYRTKIGPSSLVAQVNINNVTDTEYYNLRARWSNLPAEPLTVLGTIRLEY